MLSEDKKTVQVVPYDHKWPSIFASESEKVAKVLGHNLKSIHHVGSTSIEGLAAKPKIDIAVIVKDYSKLELLDLGYEFRGFFNLPFRKFFRLRRDIKVNLHVFEEDSEGELELLLLFRDYLRTHSLARSQYQILKYELLNKADSHEKNGMFVGYTLGKDAFIQSVLKKAGFDKPRLVFCTHYAEWEKAKEFRQKYFFTARNVEDPYTWTFAHENHRHLMLYLGVKIVGYAHIELWPQNRAAIRIIAIDEDMRNQKNGQLFLQLCEKWLKNSGVKSVHAEATLRSLSFYRKNGYSEMPFNDPDGFCDAEDLAMGKEF